MKFLTKLIAALQRFFLQGKKKGKPRKPHKQKAKKEEIPLEWGSEQDHSIIFYIFEPLERIKKNFRSLLAGIIQESIELASLNLPEAEQKEPPPYENSIIQLGQATIFEIYALLKGFIGVIYNLAYKAKHEFEKFFSDGIINLKELKNWNKEKEDIEKKAVNSFYEAKINYIQFLIDDRIKRIKKAEENIEKLAHQLKITSSVKYVKEVGVMFYVWNSIIILSEVVATITSLAILRESMYLVAPLAFGISVIIFLGADFSGKMLKSYSVYKEKKRIVVPIIVCLSVLVLCLFLGASRLLYIEEETGRELALVLQVGLVSINVVLFIISLFLSFSMFHPDIPRVKEYNHVQKLIARYKKEIRKWTDALAVLKDDWQKKLLEIRIKYEELDKEIKELVNNIKNAKANYANRINMVCALLFETVKLINAETKGAISTSRQKNYENRPDKRFCEYYKIIIEDLVFINDLYEMFYPFLKGEKNMLFQKKGYSVPQSEINDNQPEKELNEESPINEPEIKQDEMENFNEFVTSLGDIHQKVNDSEKINEMLNLKTDKNMRTKVKSKTEKKPNGSLLPAIIDPIKPFMLVVVALIVFGCNQDNQNTVVKFDNDQTPEATVVRENISVEKILKMMKINMDGNRNNGGTFETSIINDVSRNESKKAELAIGSIAVNKFTRRDEIKAFSDDLKKHLDWAFSNNSHYNYSKIASAMAKSLNKLAHTPANEKFYIIASDMMQNTKQISFYRTLPQKDNYEKLMNYFESQHPLADLSGIKIIIINKPTDADIDDAINAAIAFWDYYFSQKGAEVEVRANL